jgi:hypothetical protein
MSYAIKAIEDNRFGGYTAVWGDPATLDLQGDYFKRETDFALEAYTHRPLIHHHGQTESLGRTIIGTIDKWHKDDTGLWCEGSFKRLTDDVDLFDEEERELRAQYIEKIKEKIAAGELNFSSGALGHLVERDEKGWLKKWWWAESSTTGSPAEPRQTEIELLKAIKGMDESIYTQAEGDKPSQTDTPSSTDKQETPTIAPPPEAVGDVEDANDNPQPSHDEGATNMTPEELIAMISESEFPPDVLEALIAEMTTMLDKRGEETAADGDMDEDEEDKTVEEKLAEAVTDKKFLGAVVKMVEKQAAQKTDLAANIKALKKPAPGTGGTPVPKAKANNSPRISMRSRYEEANWEAEDYAFLITAQRARNRNYQPPTSFVREATAKMLKNAERLGLSSKSMDELYRLESTAKADTSGFKTVGRLRSSRKPVMKTEF